MTLISQCEHTSAMNMNYIMCTLRCLVYAETEAECAADVDRQRNKINIRCQWLYIIVILSSTQLSFGTFARVLAPANPWWKPAKVHWIRFWISAQDPAVEQYKQSFQNTNSTCVVSKPVIPFWEWPCSGSILCFCIQPTFVKAGNSCCATHMLTNVLVLTSKDGLCRRYRLISQHLTTAGVDSFAPGGQQAFVSQSWWSPRSQLQTE